MVRDKRPALVFKGFAPAMTGNCEEGSEGINSSHTPPTSVGHHEPHQRTELDRWEGRNCRKLTEERHRLLAFLATFSAGVQVQVLASTIAGEDMASQVINAFFIGGLLADILGAILSIGSARWFEMLTQEEEDTLHERWLASERGWKSPIGSYSLVDKWISLSIVIGVYAVVLGLALFVLGLMTFVWAHQPLIVKVVSTSVFVILVIFVFPFTLRHNRLNVVALLDLRRRSG